MYFNKIYFTYNIITQYIKVCPILEGYIVRSDTSRYEILNQRKNNKSKTYTFWGTYIFFLNVPLYFFDTATQLFNNLSKYVINHLATLQSFLRFRRKKYLYVYSYLIVDHIITLLFFKYINSKLKTIFIHSVIYLYDRNLPCSDCHRV